METSPTYRISGIGSELDLIHLNVKYEATSMKMPKDKRIYCPRCNKHTEHKVSIYKKGKQRSMCESDRRVGRKKAGYGSSPKEIQHKKVKVNKKTRPMYKCKKCDYTIIGNAMRLKKFELIRG